MKSIRLAVALLLLAAPAFSQDGTTTKLRWHGHAAFSITTPNGTVLLIDPFLKNPKNPDAADGKDPIAALPKVDYILITHGHRDHVGEAVEIAKKTGAQLVSNPELAGNLVKLTGFPKEQAGDGIFGIGGEITVAGGEVMIAMTPAVHSSSIFNEKGGPTEAERAYAGNPAGFVIRVKNGPTIYHSGDTAFFRDMETIGEQYPIDVALLNTGGHYGMEPAMAARAAAAVKAKLAIPHHFGTFPGLAADTKAFAEGLRKVKIPMREMAPGETLTFRGGKLAAAAK